MSGVDREKTRVKATGEVFTPTPLVQEMLDRLPDDAFSDIDKTFLDPSCGDGQFLGEVLIYKLKALGRNNITDQEFQQALSSIYGVDLMQDNVDLCRERLLCGRDDLRHIVEQNIYQCNSLKFSYKFKPMSTTRRRRENVLRQRIKEQKEKEEQQRKEAERLAHARKIIGIDMPVVNQPKKIKKQKSKNINENTTNRTA